MREMFARSSNLTELNLSSFNTSKVTNMNDMFKSCTKMQKILVGTNWIVGENTTTENMFTDCGVSDVTH